MDRPAAAEDTTAPTLQKLCSVLFALGVLGFLALILVGASEDGAVLQVGAVVGLLVYLITFADVILGLAILIACVGLSPEVSLAGLNDLRLEDFVVPALLMSWMTRAARDRAPLVPMPAFVPILLYLGAILFSTLAGVMLETTTPQRAMLILVKYVEYFLIFVIFANAVRTPGEFKALAIFSILVALASSLMGAGRFAVAPGFAPRLHGPTGETANIFGGYLILNISLAVGLLLETRGQGARLALGAAIAALGTTLLFTYSRTSYAAQMAALVGFGFARDRRLVAVVAVLALLLPFLAPGDILQRMSTIGEMAGGPGPASWQARTDAWDVALGRVSTQSPVFGFGLGSVRFGDVDSEYVRVLVDTGIVGLALFTWVVLRLGRQGLQLHRALPGGFARGYAAGFLIAFLALLVHAIAATSFTSIRTMACFMVLCGLMTALAQRREEWGLSAPAEPVASNIFPPASLPRSQAPAAEKN